jgi:hypothetical protein
MASDGEGVCQDIQGIHTGRGAGGGVSEARLVITAVVLEQRPVSDVELRRGLSDQGLDAGSHTID